MRPAWPLAWALVAASVAASALAYARLPERMDTHWNARWEPDGQMGRPWGAFLMPLVLALTVGLLAVIPRIDPMGERYGEFREQYEGFAVLVALFLAALHGHVLAWNLGARVSLARVLPVGLGALFYYSGILCEHARRNWFVGIRTPWTLSSERVWERTHRVGGRAFKAAGLVALLGAVLPGMALALMLGPVLLASAYAVVYSYLEWRREEAERAASSQGPAAMLKPGAVP